MDGTAGWRVVVSGEVRERTDLATWLLEQVAEDERVAETGQSACVHLDFCDDEAREYDEAFGFENGPTRWRAECDTKRRIIAMFPISAPKTDGEGNFEGFQSRDCGEHRTVGGRAWCHDCGEWCYPDAPCVRCHGVSDVLRLMALPYRDRPGYVEDWSPDGR
jgi:hypothetical protein